MPHDPSWIIFHVIFFIFFHSFEVLRKEPVLLRTRRTRVRPGLFSELLACRTKVQPCLFSQLRTCQGSEKGTGLSPNSEPAEPGLGLVLSPNSKPARVRSSEKGTGHSPNSEPAELGFGPVLTQNLPGYGVWRKELVFLRTCRTRVIPVLSPNSEPAEPGLYLFFLWTANWNSKLRAKTQSWTILKIWPRIKQP